jgi:hypothetical protein
VAGVCQPVALTDYQDAVSSLAVDDAYVYWTNNNTVNRISLNGGATSVLSSSEGLAREMTINADSVFWFDELADRLRQVKFVNGTPSTLIPGYQYAYGMAANQTQFFWVSPFDKQINTVTLANGLKYTLATTTGYPLDLKIDSANVYWTEYTPSTSISIKRMPLLGGTPVVLATVPESLSTPMVLRFDIDAAYAYWIDDTNSLKKVPLAGGTPTVLATFPSTTLPESLAVSGAAYLSVCDYNTSPNCSALVKVPLDGGAPVTLLSGLTEAMGTLVARGPAIYYGTSGYTAAGPARIMKLAK